MEVGGCHVIGSTTEQPTHVLGVTRQQTVAEFDQVCDVTVDDVAGFGRAEQVGRCARLRAVRSSVTTSTPLSARGGVGLP